MTVEIGFPDALVLVVLLITAVAIGVWFGRRNTDAESFLLAGRSLPWWAILGSIVATETSTATVLSIPGAGYGSVGMRWLQLPMGFLLGRLIVVRVFLPLYFSGRLSTAYQVLETRFDNRVRKGASLLFLVTRNLGDGLRLFLAGLVVHELMGWPFAASVIAMGAVTVVYTVLGGIRSVVWNDCIQFVIYMIGGIAAVFIIGHAIPGGWGHLWEWAEQHGKLQIIETDFSISDPYNIWAGLIGGALLSVGTHGTDHMMVQRYLSSRSQQDASRAVTLSGVVVLAQFALFLFIGVQLACFYETASVAVPKKADQAFADFIIHHFPKDIGLIGLMLSAILAAAMSTLSSSLNASASAVLNDFYLPLRAEPVSAQHQLRLSRRLTVLFAVLQTCIGIGAYGLDGTVVQGALTIAGFAAGLLLGVFSLGVLTRHVGSTAAGLGALCGLTVLLLISFSGDVAGIQVAWPWLPAVGALTTFCTGWLAARTVCKIHLPDSEND